VDVSCTLTYGENQQIDVTISDDQPYNPDVVDDMARRATDSLLRVWTIMLGRIREIEATDG
jgi:hypothetical protein